MSDLPVETSPEAEVATLRKANAELTQKASTRKIRIKELESNTAALIAKATEAEARIRQLTIDGPVNDLCESISVAPQALRSALESQYKIEMQNGVLTLLNPSDGKPVLQDGKPVPFTTEAIKSLLLASKDAEKQKLFRAIIVVNKASGSGGTVSKPATAPAPQPSIRFGLR